MRGVVAFVEIPAPTGDFGDGEFTLALWFSSTRAGTMLSRRAACWNVPRNGGEDINLGLDGRIGAEVLSDGTYFTLAAGPDHNDGAWHHLALTRRGAIVELSIDGRVASSHEVVGSFDNALGAPSYVGVSRCATGAPGSNGTADNRPWYLGRVDEVACYPRALSRAELVAQAEGRCRP